MSTYESSITNPKKQLEFYKNLSEQLQRENQELKKQLEEYKNSQSCSFVNICKNVKIANYNQQKEFIKWLENGIEKVKNTEFLDERIQKAGLIAYNRCLQKYKSIIGDDK